MRIILLNIILSYSKNDTININIRFDICHKNQLVQLALRERFSALLLLRSTVPSQHGVPLSPMEDLPFPDLQTEKGLPAAGEASRPEAAYGRTACRISSTNHSISDDHSGMSDVR